MLNYNDKSCSLDLKHGMSAPHTFPRVDAIAQGPAVGNTFNESKTTKKLRFLSISQQNGRVNKLLGADCGSRVVLCCAGLISSFLCENKSLGLAGRGEYLKSTAPPVPRTQGPSGHSGRWHHGQLDQTWYEAAAGVVVKLTRWPLIDANRRWQRCGGRSPHVGGNLNPRKKRPKVKHW